MKQMTCAQMGGPCDAKFSGNTEKEITDIGMVHITAKHTEMAERMQNMSPEDNNKWTTHFHKKWEATKETK